VFCAVLLVAVVLRLMPAPQEEALARALRSTVLRPVLALQRGTVDRSVQFADPARLRAERDSLAAFLVGHAGISAENQELRGLLGLGPRLAISFVPAEVTRVSGRDVGAAFLITAGADDGVQPGDPIVAAAGLVGRVLSVEPRAAVAIDWTHPQFRASAMTSDGETFGILQPRQRATEEPLLELTGTPFHSDLQPGDLLVTSGHGLYPRGIPVGRVVRPAGEDQWQKSYVVRPIVSPGEMTYVLVLGRRTEGMSGADLAQSWGIRVAQDRPARDTLRIEEPGAMPPAATPSPAQAAPPPQPRPRQPRLLGEPVQRPPNGAP
jgi:cell shape-determining protein MreC